MTGAVGVRIVATTDFVGSFFPQPTSYGHLPGAAALQSTVDDLRTQAGGALWVDTGDFAQGSALGALTDGAWPFLALRELSIDVAVVGNHELDWGVEHLRRWSPELSWPLLAANLPLGLPATQLLGAGGPEVGVIGMSLPDMAAMHPGVVADPDPAARVIELAQDLRGDGARHIVLALHDGVDARPGAAARMEELCRRLRGGVDLVLGGHTLACHAGSLAGVPFLQPWAFGSQVGVADLREDGSVGLQLAEVGAPRPWTGVGSGAQEALEAEVVGRLEEPLLQTAGRVCTLAEAIAAGVLHADEALDAVYVGQADIWNQPARDGVGAFVGAGDVSRAQVLRLTPFCGGRSAWGGQLVAAELSGPDAEQAIAALEPGTVAKRPGRCPRTLALTPFYAATVDRAAGCRHDWHRIEATLRDGLMDAVTR